MTVPAWVLLTATPNPQLPYDKSRVEPGWIALVFLVVLGGAVTLLWFSMRKHLGRIDVGRHERESRPPAPRDGGGAT